MHLHNLLGIYISHWVFIYSSWYLQIHTFFNYETHGTPYTMWLAQARPNNLRDVQLIKLIG